MQNNLILEYYTGELDYTIIIQHNIWLILSFQAG